MREVLDAVKDLRVYVEGEMARMREETAALKKGLAQLVETLASAPKQEMETRTAIADQTTEMIL